MSLTARITALLIVLGLLGAGVWRLQVKADAAGYQRAQQEYQAAAELQREANRSRAQAAVTNYAQRERVREKFTVITVKEIRDATANLAACPVLPAARSVLDRAVTCAGEERPASCGSDDTMR